MALIKMNGVNYWGSSYGQGIIAPMIYSEDEIEVGVWTDSKPLYQKTVHISALPSSAGVLQYPHNISNIDKVCHYESISRSSTGSAVILNRVGLNGTNFNGAISYDVFVNTTIINISVGQDRSNIEADVTIWYTKTTDTAGSGTYTPSKALAVHYSTNEQVIGTWIDGKPLYEKTVNIPSLPNATQSTYAHGIVNYKEFVSVTGYAKNSTGTNFPLPFANASNANYAITLFINNDNITINTGTSDRSSYSGYVTLRYTKTTD